MADDAEVFKNSVLFPKLQMGQLKLPHDRQLQSPGKKLPYVFPDDSAAALSRRMMKPYPACVLLHSFMRKSPSASYSPPGTFDTESDDDIVLRSWRNDQNGMTSFMPLKKRLENQDSLLAGSFVKIGKLPWPEKYC
ncbi:hypothetical protein HNY73_017492 [Argiope bruennichi]|uniref:Uncharacterized protein n=1 Tax=Argiope bruennichi TaxID=94029 RepID=A0A8T0EAV5_ARGBR|nr:hypothetical protein HNY73_017492 [Argiope bruennichi]